jgi:hypothetical protein
MTRFLVGVTASWTCIADHIRRIVDILVFYGALDTNGTPWAVTDRDPDDPTYVSLTENDITGDKEVRLYWGLTTDAGDEGWYLAWNDTGGIVDGVLIIDVVNMGSVIDTAEDPEFMRMDFLYTGTEQTADAFLSFFTANLWADAFRIHVFKDLVNNDPRYVARGILALKAQFDPIWATNTGDTSVPGLNMYTVADANGNGAALALMSDIGLSLDLQQGDHLGNFLFGKNDRYYFSSGGAPVYVLKTVTPATYVNGKDLSGPSWPDSDADVDTALSTGGDYATCTGTEPYTGAECESFLDALFGDADWWADVNFGTDPGDWRTTRLDAAEGDQATYFLGDTCPDNVGPCTWDRSSSGVFEMTYPPNP